jgi:hypothetical protein
MMFHDKDKYIISITTSLFFSLYALFLIHTPLILYLFCRGKMHGQREKVLILTICPEKNRFTAIYSWMDEIINQ